MLQQNPNSFYAPRTPLQAAVATVTTEQDIYYASDICFASPNSKTAKHGIVVTRLSDKAVAPALSELIVKSGGYSSVAGIGSWPTFQQAVAALLEQSVQWFECQAVRL
ncbi:hypothetical protein [Deinococcus sp. UYEF24]